MMGFGWMHGYGGMGLLGGLIGLIFNLVVIVGIAWLVIWAVRRFTGADGNWSRSAGSQSPREVLELRYARGEITRDQFRQMLKDLA